jgi:Flp pilus assembly protein TadG
MNILNRHFSKRNNRQQGVAAIEAAIVLPVVLFVMLAVAEFGHAIQQYNQLTQAVRDGARYLANEAERGPGVVFFDPAKTTAARNLVVYGTTGTTVDSTAVLTGLTIAGVTVTGTTSGTDVSVTAAYPYTPIFFPNIATIVGADDDAAAFTMQAHVTMRVL